jgi:DNA-binding transcriptional ArsR family regulator
MPAALGILDDPEAAAALLKPSRIRILELLTEPDSASGVARKLGMPRQLINYHLRELETAGLVEFVEERRKGNCTERLLRSKARSWLIDPGSLGSLRPNPESIADHLSSAFLVACAARLIKEVAGLRRRAERAGKRLGTLTLDSNICFRSPADRAAFTVELTDAFTQLVAKYHYKTAPGGRTFRLLLGAWPSLPEIPPAIPNREE